MLIAERIITTHTWELYRSIFLLPVLPPSLTWTRVNSLMNDAIQYGTHGTAQQVNFMNDTVQDVRFVLGKILTNGEVCTWQASSHT